jgi:hypothetical protein
MLCNSVPGHHVFNHLRTPSSPILFQFQIQACRSLSQSRVESDKPARSGTGMEPASKTQFEVSYGRKMRAASMPE